MLCKIDTASRQLTEKRLHILRLLVDVEKLASSQSICQCVVQLP